MSAAMQMQVGTMSSQRPMPELDERQFARRAELLGERLVTAVTPKRKVFFSCRQHTRMLDQLTIHETRFHHDRASFRLLEEHTLPALQQQVTDTINIKAWSVGEIVSGQPEGLKSMKIKDTLAYRRIKD